MFSPSGTRASESRRRTELAGAAQSVESIGWSIKTRYRRISGRKNWNRYLLRYGRRVAYYEAQVRLGASAPDLEARMRGISHRRWRTARAEQHARQEEQLKQYRVRHRRAQFLAKLEARWAETAPRTPLLP